MLVGHDLKYESRERLFRIGRPLFFGSRFGIDANDCRHIKRARKEIDDCVKQRLHAFVLKGGAGHHRNELQRDRLASKRRANLGVGDLFAREVLLSYLVVRIGKRFDHLVARGCRISLKVARYVDNVGFGALVLDVVENRSHRNQVDHAAELIFGSDRILDRNRIRAAAGRASSGSRDRSQRPGGPSYS